MIRFLILVAVCATLFDLNFATAAPPNVVMIISDDQGWTDYGFMGHEEIRTPHIDRLAKQSLTYTRGYVPSSLCRPSLATLITGLYPHQHGITGNDPPKKYKQDRNVMLKHIRSTPTLPKLLAEKDYLSLQTGKWWEGPPSEAGFTQAMTHGDPTRGGRHGDLGLKVGREGLQPVFDFIEEAGERPFFVWYAPFLPHTPHNPPKRLFEKYASPDKSDHVARYQAMCEWFDETVGELLTYLDEQKLSDDTLIVYVTDNGWIQAEEASRYAPRSKRSPHEGGIRTPIMYRWPGRIEPRIDRETLAHSLDIAPTILAAAGLEPTDVMPGSNVLEDDLAERNTVFGEIFAHDVADIDDPQQSLQYLWVIDGWWKLIQPAIPNKELKLYNLQEDPFETNNLAVEHPERIQLLQGLLKQEFRTLKAEP